MTLDAEIRETVRAAYQRCCGYCSVCEGNVGGKLEIDHFQPLRHQGTDALENLVYACTTCNRFKGDYWPAPNAPANLSLLHPAKDTLDDHLYETTDGRLTGLTPRGWFHIERLHLNRPQLIEFRRARQITQRLQNEATQTQTVNTHLQQHVRELETELTRLRETIAKLSQMQ